LLLFPSHVTHANTPFAQLSPLPARGKTTQIAGRRIGIAFDVIAVTGDYDDYDRARTHSAAAKYFRSPQCHPFGRPFQPPRHFFAPKMVNTSALQGMHRAAGNN
jgi:hypothetical protein